MIELEKARKAFENYVKNYDEKEPKNQIKIQHTHRVEQMSTYIAEELNLSKEDIQLAQLIGLLHDIGRFEQLKRYHSFDDVTTVDHADFSAELLFQEQKIREFIEDTQYDSIIEKAIRNHNKYQMEEGLSEKELLHAKIIRDADKADNFYLKTYVDFKVQYGTEEIGNQVISDKVYQAILEHHCVLSKDRQTNMDEWVSYLGWIFDFNFSSSLKWIIEKGYLEALLRRVNYSNQETAVKMQQIEKEIMEFAQQRIKE